MRVTLRMPEADRVAVEAVIGEGQPHRIARDPGQTVGQGGPPSALAPLDQHRLGHVADGDAGARRAFEKRKAMSPVPPPRPAGAGHRAVRASPSSRFSRRGGRPRSSGRSSRHSEATREKTPWTSPALSFSATVRKPKWVSPLLGAPVRAHVACPSVVSRPDIPNAARATERSARGRTMR